MQAVAEEAFAGLARRNDGSVNGLPTRAIEFEVEPVVRAITASALGHVLFGQTLPPEEAEHLEKMLGPSTKVSERGTPARINRAMSAVFGVLRLAAHQPILFP